MCEKDTGRQDLEIALKKIEFEHWLIYHRMSWMLTTTGFLFATYFVIPRLNERPVSANENATLSYLIIFSGIASSLLFYASIWAAFAATSRWRMKVEEKYRHWTVSAHLIHQFGDAPPAVLPIMILVIWVGLAWGDWSSIKQLDGLTLVFPPIALLAGFAAWIVRVLTMFRKIEFLER